MTNPFKYGGVVGRGAFCNRKQELKDLIRAMENGQRLFLYSERRIGKTSLVMQALSNLPKDKYLTVYADLWATDCEESFITQLAASITQSIETTADKMLHAAKRYFGALAPGITLDSQGQAQLTFASISSESKKMALVEALSVPEMVAKKRKCKVVIILDEFQRILEYGDDRVERTLRSVIQHQEQVSYIFLGSRKHMIGKMFLDQSRPLYRAGDHYPLGPIATEHWVPFIKTRFQKSEKQIDRVMISHICETTEGHPFYTQHLCHAIWELCESGEKVTGKMLSAAIDLLLDRENYAYTALWDSFGTNQRRFLAGLAHEPPRQKVYSSEFIGRYALRSASNAQRVVESLLEKDIVDRDNGSFLISDRFFRIWIKQKTPQYNRAT